MVDPAPTVTRSIFKLALPVLPVLAAEPLYLLRDAYIVGFLGQMPLAALGAASVVLLVLGSQMTFLAYGTTARAARHHGSGRDDLAISEGLQATWIAVLVGIGVSTLVSFFRYPIVSALTRNPDLLDPAAQWIAIAAWGIPAILIASAGHGWLRGVQRTRAPLIFVACGVIVSTVTVPLLVHGLGSLPALGLSGSAVANVAGQWITAAGFVLALRREVARNALPGRGKGLADYRPQWAVISAQLKLGRDLIVRTASFQVLFLLAASTAAAGGVATLGAHHLAQQLWTLLTLVLDSVAIAAQSLIGAALGATQGVQVERDFRGRTAEIDAIVTKVIRFSCGLGVILAVLLAAAAGPLTRILAPTEGVAAELHTALIFMVALLPIAAVVFGLDGIALGAADAAYLRTSTALVVFAGSLPVLVITRHFGGGIEGVWVAIAVLIFGRGIALWLRLRGSRWLNHRVETGSPL